MSVLKKNRINNNWFRKGVEAFKILMPEFPDYYVCPLCLYGFPIETVTKLTCEHVPPKSIGGQRLVLTCWKCNNKASGKNGIDTHASHAEINRKINEGLCSGNMYAKLNINGFDINVECEYTKNKISIFGLPNNNPSGHSDKFKNILDKYVDSKIKDWQFNLNYKQFKISNINQHTSWLRAGYLAAFASLGYRYIFREVLNDVREQIQYPSSSKISHFHFYNADGSNEKKYLMFVRKPEWAKGLLVNIGKHYIMLPFLDNDKEFYTRMAKNCIYNHKTTLEGSFLPWPMRPEYRLDFATSQELIDLIKDFE